MQDAIKPALEEKKEDCVHTFITTLDFRRSCTICGLVVEHIKDMVFMWHKPVRVLNFLKRSFSLLYRHCGKPCHPVVSVFL